MKKIIKINGMSCGHCQAKVEKALAGLNGVSAKVDLKKKQAIVELNSDISEQVLKDTITEAGYEVVSITEKKGLFGR
ncbi:MAG: heavy-metal-associated domain-containing protein [Clostridiales bacterium]|nr:heavy-metal-associated domain-containing protein [Clostridiales bacterium]